jgi:hypothetical protein
MPKENEQDQGYIEVAEATDNNEDGSENDETGSDSENDEVKNTDTENLFSFPTSDIHILLDEKKINEAGLRQIIIDPEFFCRMPTQGYILAKSEDEQEIVQPEGEPRERSPESELEEVALSLLQKNILHNRFVEINLKTGQTVAARWADPLFPSKRKNNKEGYSYRPVPVQAAKKGAHGEVIFSSGRLVIKNNKLFFIPRDYAIKTSLDDLTHEAYIASKFPRLKASLATHQEDKYGYSMRAHPDKQELTRLIKYGMKSQEAVELILRIALELFILELLKITYRDLSPKNILINPQSKVVALIDAGSSKLTKASNNPTSITKDYASPEALNGKGNSKKSNIFSLGLIFAEALDKKISEITLEKRKNTLQCCKHKKIRVKQDGLDSLHPGELKNFITRMTESDEEKRPDLEKVIAFLTCILLESQCFVYADIQKILQEIQKTYGSDIFQAVSEIVEVGLLQMLLNEAILNANVIISSPKNTMPVHKCEIELIINSQLDKVSCRLMQELEREPSLKAIAISSRLREEVALTRKKMMEQFIGMQKNKEKCETNDEMEKIAELLHCYDYSSNIPAKVVEKDKKKDGKQQFKTISSLGMSLEILQDLADLICKLMNESFFEIKKPREAMKAIFHCFIQWADYRVMESADLLLKTFNDEKFFDDSISKNIDLKYRLVEIFLEIHDRKKQPLSAQQRHFIDGLKETIFDKTKKIYINYLNNLVEQAKINRDFSHVLLHQQSTVFNKLLNECRSKICLQDYQKCCSSDIEDEALFKEFLDLKIDHAFSFLETFTLSSEMKLLLQEAKNEIRKRELELFLSISDNASSSLTSPDKSPTLSSLFWRAQSNLQDSAASAISEGIAEHNFSLLANASRMN